MGDRIRVRAAGVLPYTVKADGSLRVALVHRPHYDDWSWAKGKLDRGEDWAAAAAREALEETGLVVRLGMPLPDAHYRVGSGMKRVRYWAATVVGGEGNLEHEIDEVVWLKPKAAAERLSYAHDREQLEALVDLHDKGRLDTWPLLIVRHALAVSRTAWSRPDPLRPLVFDGYVRAAHLVGLIDAYAPEQILSSPSVRCTATVRPFSESLSVPITTKKGLSEEGFEATPDRVVKHLDGMLAAGRPAAICTHGPLIPVILKTLRSRAAKTLDSGDRRLLTRLTEVPLDKGEVLALTMSGTGDEARVAAVERHRPVL
ncbi:NUDIX hydrolase [Ornithinimicrobium panacihumi]|uniref:NUDIX hydrolase n=1 Tax=Ornithinimicrobium panacihumi TaxID=2008449 RepID=UPI003F8881A6